MHSNNIRGIRESAPFWIVWHRVKKWIHGVTGSWYTSAQTSAVFARLTVRVLDVGGCQSGELDRRRERANQEPIGIDDVNQGTGTRRGEMSTHPSSDKGNLGSHRFEAATGLHPVG